MKTQRKAPPPPLPTMDWVDTDDNGTAYTLKINDGYVEVYEYDGSFANNMPIETFIDMAEWVKSVKTPKPKKGAKK